jgi:hypothetical protein
VSVQISAPSAARHDCPHDGPTTAALLAFVHRAAADPAVVARLPPHTRSRSWARLDGPAGSEAWIIGWPPGAETGWHDHGGSRGAFATAAGRLDEHYLATELPTGNWRALELLAGFDRSHTLTAGRGRAFGPRHVHQVANRDPGLHAVSVHAYYPPLPLVRRYSRTGDMLLLQAVESPEQW